MSLLLLGAGVTLTAFTLLASADRSSPAGYGVSSVDGDPGIAIHWVVCAGQSARVVDLEGYWGGSSLPTAVPVLWQARSGVIASGETRVETYIVGDVPPGFYETVPLRRHLPRDLVTINGPPGGGLSEGGMSFLPADLQRELVYTGDYLHVSMERFRDEGAAGCGGAASAGSQPVGLILSAAGVFLLAGRRRPMVTFVAAMVAVVGSVALAATLGLRLPLTVGDQGPTQGAEAFGSRPLAIPAERPIILELSPRTHPPRADGSVRARIQAPGAYSFAVGCEGPSIHIGEASEIENGSTGSRQLVGCATQGMVRGSIAASADRHDVVDIFIDPNGMTDWTVLVVQGEGNLGPFDED